MKHENAFFTRLIEQLSPGWNVQLQPHLEPGRLDLGRYQARIYLIDTSSGWTAAAAMAPESFEEARRSAAKAKLSQTRLLDAAGQAVAHQSRRQAEADDPELTACFQLVAAALTGTQTFQAVKANGLAGHWLYLAYRGHDASITCRPMYFSAAEPGFCSPETLEQITRQIIAHDLRPGSNVANTLRQSGGAVIAPAYRA